MEDKDVLKMLFEEHHRQISKWWNSINHVVKGTIALFSIMTGWVLLARNPPPDDLKSLIIVIVSVFSVLSCIVILYYEKNIKTIGTVIIKINSALGLYENDRYIEGDSIYPEKWKTFGLNHKWQIVGNIITICCSAIICVSAVWLR